jgi:hypothetical protein
MIAAAAALLAASLLVRAQTPAAPIQAQAKTPTAVANPVPHHRKRPSAAHPAPAPTLVEPVTQPPPEPPKPNWPAFDQPTEASVVWDSHGLQIDAKNSSLQQILKEVSTITGVKVDGLNSDQRIFGVYGPGQARDVLSQLLQGSGYNVIMVGGEGHGVPREIQLSQRQNNALQQPLSRPTPMANNNNDEDDAAEEPVQQEQPPHPGYIPGGQPRSPQQIMEEMRMRQQQMQQQAPQTNPPQ